MYVMNKKWDSITNIAQCTSVYVSPEHEIKAVPTGGGAVYRLGQYETAEIARAVLNDLYMHIPTGCMAIIWKGVSMFKVMQQYGTAAQPATVYYCDDEADLQNIKSAPMGAQALVIHTGNIYIADSTGKFYPM